jgi:hypothetical protein
MKTELGISINTNTKWIKSEVLFWGLSFPNWGVTDLSAM